MKVPTHWRKVWFLKDYAKNKFLPCPLGGQGGRGGESMRSCTLLPSQSTVEPGQRKFRLPGSAMRMQPPAAPKGLGLRVTAAPAPGTSATLNVNRCTWSPEGVLPMQQLRAGPHSGSGLIELTLAPAYFTQHWRPLTTADFRGGCVLFPTPSNFFWYQQGYKLTEFRSCRLRVCSHGQSGAWGLQSLGWQSVRHDWVINTLYFAHKIALHPLQMPIHGWSPGYPHNFWLATNQGFPWPLLPWIWYLLEWLVELRETLITYFVVVQLISHI